MATAKSKYSDLNDLDWLNVFYKSATEIGQIVVDDFSTIKRRVIDVNEVDLREGSGSNSLVTRNAVKNFVQSISKSVENLGELKIEIFRELKARYPHWEGDWLSENCVSESSSSSVKCPNIVESSSSVKCPNSVESSSSVKCPNRVESSSSVKCPNSVKSSSSVKCPNNVDSHAIKNGEVSEESDSEGEQMELDIPEVINHTGMTDTENESHATDEDPDQTRSITPTEEIISPEVARIEENENVVNTSTEIEETEVLNKSKSAVDDEGPRLVKLSELSSVIKTLDKESLKAKKQVLMSSSDEEDFKQTPKRKPFKPSPSQEKSKEQDNSKPKVKSRPSPRSKKRESSSDETEDAEKPKKEKEAKTIRKRKMKVDPDYWKNHDMKDDEKLQNLDGTVVVVERLDKSMAETLKRDGVISIASQSESESEIANKRISRALKNFNKFDPIVDEDKKERNRSSKNGKGNRNLRSRKCKEETKYGLDSASGSEENDSSDNSVHIPAPKSTKVAKDSSSNDDSSACEIVDVSDSDNEKAKKNVLDDSDEEAVDKSKEKKKDNSEKSDKDSKDKRKNYYVPGVCRLSTSESDGDEKQESSRKLRRKPKEDVKKSKKFSEDDSSDEFMPPKKRNLRGKKKVSSGTEEISDESSDESEPSDSSSGKKKSKRRGKRQNSSSEEETTKKKKRKRIRVADSDDSSSSKKQNGTDSDVQEIEKDKEDDGSPSKGRKKIRKVMSKKELEQTTREAEKEEDERKRRVLEKQKLVIFNSSQFDAPENDTIESLPLDFDPETKETIVAADASVVCKLKPHQARGIKFIYDCTIESTEQIKKGNQGGGCIIAHCMGLGKTLTTITFVHAALTHKILKFKTVLIICPLNTVTNWYNELRNWLSDVDVRVNVHKLWDQKTNKDRASALAYFTRRGGVGIIHYDLFRRLADLSGQKKLSAKIKEQINENLLDPGADIVVCDEGHVLKNDKSKLSIAVNKIKTRRRIVLTGTPLQNNLAEYHTMMSFVKPNLLGTLKEFQNRFINPIKNGQHADSGDYDVKLMKKRAHVLHKLLDGCVQRLDYTVLVPYLPPKHEYVVMVKITPKQVELYKHYLENLMSRTSTIERHRSLLKNYAYLLKIWTHPIVLTRIPKKKGDGVDDDSGSESEGSLKDFIVDGSGSSSESDSGSDIDWVNEHNKKIKKKKAEMKPKEEPVVVPVDPLDDTPQELAPDWYLNFFESKEDMMDPLLGGKVEVLMEIIKICESIGDKLLVFSQYLSSLNLIEEFLQHWDNEGKENERKTSISFPQNLGLSVGRWRKNIEYYRIDGGTKTETRQDHCDKFNSKVASRAKLFLISTKAGGLGINLVGANRVVIFDASWNPSHDMQSIYRVYRFGQTKPCYIYRLLAQGTMEEKIYNRQVVKLSLSGRVVDEHQIERHFKFEETNSLYLYEDPDEKVDRPIPPVPKDRLLADLLISQKDRITTYLEHDTLLVNKIDEGLTEEERKAAWDEYHIEKTHRPQVQQTMSDGSTFYKIWNILQQRYPASPPEVIKQWSDTILNKINELQLCLNYYNMHQHALSPEEDHNHKKGIEDLRGWISKALGTGTTVGHQAPAPVHAQRGQPVVTQYPAAVASSSRPQIPVHGNPEVQILPQVDIVASASSLLRQHMVQAPPQEIPPAISQGMQEALSRVGGPTRWNTNP